MSRPIVLAAAVLIVWAGGAAAAQEAGSRAEEEARRQQEKARALSKYQPGLIERQILAIEDAGGFGAARGLFVTFGDIKRGSGIAGGPAYGKVLSSGTTVIAKAEYSYNRYSLAQFSALSPPLSGDRLRLSGRVRWQDAPSVRLYELGTESSSVGTHYAERKSEASGRAQFRAMNWLRFGGALGFERFATGRADTAPGADRFFAVPGMDADPDYLHTEASAALDSRDGEGYSRHGSFLRATLHQYAQQNDGPYSFRRVDADAEQYVPVLHGNWVFFFGLHASTTSTSSGHEVPFFLMPDLGGRDLRGFGNYRFRDRHSIYMTAEYRWYAQEYLDAAIFYDGGKVVPDRAALDFTNFHHSVGAGVRLHGTTMTALRLEIARSRETTRFIVSFSAVGQ